MIDDAKRAEWRRLAEAATPGPWDVLLPAEYHCTPLVVRRGVQVRDGGEVASTNENSGQAHDAPFLAAARKAVPALLDEVERLTRERDEARAELGRLQRLPSMDEARAGAVIMRVAADAARAGARDQAVAIREAVDLWKTDCGRAKAERDALRAEVERLRAALEWIDQNGRDPACCAAAQDALVRKP